MNQIGGLMVQEVVYRVKAPCFSDLNPGLRQPAEKKMCHVGMVQKLVGARATLKSCPNDAGAVFPAQRSLGPHLKQ